MAQLMLMDDAEFFLDRVSAALVNTIAKARHIPPYVQYYSQAACHGVVHPTGFKVFVDEAPC